LNFRTQIVLASIALCFLVGCSKDKPSAETVAPGGAPRVAQVDRVEPSSTAEKTDFNVQPNGSSAIAVFGQIPGGSTVLWNGQPLQTTGGGAQGWVAAVVPPALYQTAGTSSIAVRTADDAPVSNTVDFTVYGKTGPPPGLVELFPHEALAGKGFNVQPNGESALGVSGGGFLPGVTLLFDGKKMRTVFGKGTGLSAAIPADLISKAGTHEVWAVNPDSKASNKMKFVVR
jgi:hypothetical protein